MMRRIFPFLVIPFLAAALPGAVRAQELDLSSGGPVEITAQDGIEWRQNEQQVVARGNARAVRGKVTVVADQLIAHYRRKQPAGTTSSGAPTGATPSSTPAAKPASGPLDTDAGGNEVYRLEAVGHVFVYTETDRAQADRAIYDMDQAVLVLTGADLKLSSPGNVLTARDAVEYWSQKHMAVARGDAVVTTDDAKRISADTIVAYTVDDTAPVGAAPAKPVPAAKAAAGSDALAAGKLQRVEIFGNVQVRTATQIVRGDRGVYVPDTGIALLVGNARLTQGRNQVNGAALEVNLQTGIYRLLSAPGARVRGLIMPNGANGVGEPSGEPAKRATPAPASPAPAPSAPAPSAPGGKSR